MWRSIFIVGGAVVVACGFVAGFLALSKGNKVTDEPKQLTASKPEEKPAEEEIKEIVAKPVPPKRKPAKPAAKRPITKREAAERIKRKFNGRGS